MSIGIYAIVNKINNKRYVGKSIDINRRFGEHKRDLIREVKYESTNPHLYNAAQKHGLGNFDFIIIEEFDTVDEDLIAERELYWIDYYDCCNSDYGYNLTRNTSAKMIIDQINRDTKAIAMTGELNPNYNNKWSDLQKKEMSDIAKDRHRDLDVYGDEWKMKISKASSELWADHNKKQQMAESVSVAKSIYRFYQYDKYTSVLVKVWDSMSEIIKVHPDYHNIAIYSVCNGHKKSYRGYAWRKELKI